MGKEICISVNGVSKKYLKQEVLHEVSLQIQTGEIYGFLGPSGAGKTTLIRLMMGMEKPSHGNIEILGNPVPHTSIIEKIGYTAQADALYTDLTAEENMKFYCELYKVPKKEWNARIIEALSVVNLQGEAKKIVGHYSGGMKRRLSLAISLLHHPTVLILDEPTVGMDPVLRQQIWEELIHLKEKGITIVITTHVMDEAEKCDNLAMIRNGICIATGSPQKLKEESKCSTLEEVFLQLGGN